MKEKRDDDDANTVSELAKTICLPYPVRLSDELSELLKPNEFLTGLGIRHDDRINSVLSSLKGSLVPKSSSLKETVPKDGVVFSMPQQILLLKKPDVVRRGLPLRSSEKSR